MEEILRASIRIAKRTYHQVKKENNYEEINFNQLYQGIYIQL
jgi:hypothetical protein